MTMKTEYQIIKKRVRNELKNRKIIDEKIVEEFTQTCFDYYNLSLENGESKNDALKSFFFCFNRNFRFI